MSLARTVALVLIGSVLLSTVAGLNGVVAADRTVLNADYVDETFADADAYEELAATAREQVLDEVGSIGGTTEVAPGVTAGSVDAAAVAEETITEAYVRSQARENLDAVYAYLHGDSADLELTIDAEQAEQNLASAIAAEGIQVDRERLLSSVGDRLARASPLIQTDTPVRLARSQSSFERTRAAFRDRVRRLVREETGASGDQLDRAVDQRLSTLNTRLKRQVEPAGDATGPEGELQSATATLGKAVIDGLTAETSYGAFTDRLETAESSIEQAAARAVQAEAGGSLGEELTVPEDRQEEIEDRLDPAAGYVQQLGLLGMVLPVVAVLLVGAAYGLTRSIESTAKLVGSSLLIAGLFGFLIPTLLEDTTLQFVRDAFGGENIEGVADAGIALVEGYLGTIAAQSLGLLVVGVACYGLAYADRTGRLDPLKTRVAGAVGSGEDDRPGAGYRQGQPRGGHRQGQQPGGHQQGPQGGHQQGQSEGGHPQQDPDRYPREQDDDRRE